MHPTSLTESQGDRPSTVIATMDTANHSLTKVYQPAFSYRELTGRYVGESSGWIKDRIDQARSLQKRRFPEGRAPLNARMTEREIKQHCQIDEESGRLIEMAMEKLGLSARAYTRILKVARRLPTSMAGKPSTLPLWPRRSSIEVLIGGLFSDKN